MTRTKTVSAKADNSRVYAGLAANSFAVKCYNLLFTRSLTGLDLLNPKIFDAQRGTRIANESLALLEATQVRIVGDESYPDLWKRAAQLKSQYRRISLADCFGVALANELKAPFWTSDRHELTALADAGVAQIQFIR